MPFNLLLCIYVLAQALEAKIVDQLRLVAIANKQEALDQVWLASKRAGLDQTGGCSGKPDQG